MEWMRIEMNEDGTIAWGAAASGEDLHAHCAALFPLCRSITGPGLRRTLGYVAARIPLEIHEVPSGTQVLDWTVPREWVPRSAWIRRLDGSTVVDFTNHNLHLLQYSRAIDAVLPLAELQRHLHSIPDQPELIPYRTAYYSRGWGFCLPHRLRESLCDEAYRVHIDADFKQGSLSYGECLLPGESEEEVLVSVHSCHPSLANDNLSGIALGLELARMLAVRRRRLSWRFLFIPGTIGSVAWLAQNRDGVGRIAHGLVLTCLGDGGPISYKASRRGDAKIDRIAAHVLRHESPENRLLPFSPYGYDERQYCSPGFDLPLGCLMRSPNGTFPEYHSSADNLDFVRPEHLARSFAALTAIAEVIEEDRLLVSTAPYGEPQLGRRGLYAPIGGTGPAAAGRDYGQMALLWVLNLADGRHSLLDMAERAGLPFAEIHAAARAAEAAGLLVTVSQFAAGATASDSAANLRRSRA
jgi:aminopeptidase-like protein